MLTDRNKIAEVLYPFKNVTSRYIMLLICLITSAINQMTPLFVCMILVVIGVLLSYSEMGGSYYCEDSDACL